MEPAPNDRRAASRRTVNELARHFGVTTRTIWRDLAALQEVGFRSPTTAKVDPAPFRVLAPGDVRS